ncbi:hypothetical protein [Amycolatopsis sp. RTGN1]|uniref:hypothetical protein n=1 Tax=Amycolatopsis ponsaeliensis TaxID=2992142 RepID=UPI002551B778|nr:hypothetical protein [Amycolatopsis sp. RTGN1]
MFTADDVDSGFEEGLLRVWWRAAARMDPKVVVAAPPEADTLVRVPGSVQVVLQVLSRSQLFGGVALRALMFDLKQVRRYLEDTGLREAARPAVGKLRCGW